ncbi:MAG: hypothetical protein WA789_15855 [Candidatus Acidiferrum sp.]
MSETISSRAGGPSAIAIVLVTVLALLVAPVCTSLCAASGCASDAHLEPCHGMASMAANGGEHLLAPSKTCGASDASAVLVSRDEQALLSQGLRSGSSPVLMDVSSGQGLGSSHANPGRGHRIPPESAEPVQLTTILRI